MKRLLLFLIFLSGFVAHGKGQQRTSGPSRPDLPGPRDDIRRKNRRRT